MRIQKSTHPLVLAGARRIRGQGMTEYIIVLALVAIAAVAAVSFFGAAVKGQFVQLGGEMLGTPDLTGVEAAASAEVKGAATDKNGGSTLGDYGNGGGGQAAGQGG